MTPILLALILSQPASIGGLGPPMRVNVVQPTDGGRPVSVGGTVTTTHAVDSTGAFGAGLVVPENVELHLDFSNDYLNPELSPLMALDGGASATADGGKLILQSVGPAGVVSVQTKDVAHYIPGQGMACRFTLVSSGCAANVQQEIGCGTEANGYFFGCCPSCGLDGGSSFATLRRSNGVDNWTPAASWSGTLGTTAPDITKGYPYQVVFQWLGYGRVLYMYERPSTGRFEVAHSVNYAGTSTETSIRQPSLPLRVATWHTGDAGVSILQTPSMAIVRQGVEEHSGPRRSSSNSAATSSSADVPILSIRNDTSFNGTPNRLRVHLDFVSWSVATGADVTTTLWLNTGVTGGAWNQFSANSLTSVNKTMTGIDGGGVPVMSFVGEGGLSGSENLSGYDIHLHPGDTLTVTGRSSSASPVLRIALSWMDEF